MERKNIPDAKNRILKAALKIFAHQSFEGSRIDQIAKEANVPKSLIYYHFKSKNEILDVLIKGFVDEYTQLLKKASNESHSQKAQNLPERMKTVYAGFGEENADLVRIILIESLKKSNDSPIIYKIVEAMGEVNEKAHKDSGEENYNKNESLIAEFFTSFIPLCAYLCFEESWLGYFKIEKEEFGELFLKVYSQTHVAYHENHD
jgi:AcrR family transcriptional regulator